MKTTRTADRQAQALVVDYAMRYAINRGLKPSFPSLVVALCADINGWPVRDTNTSYGYVAHFSSIEAAHAAIAVAYRAFLKTHGRDCAA